MLCVSHAMEKTFLILIRIGRPKRAGKISSTPTLFPAVLSFQFPFVYSSMQQISQYACNAPFFFSPFTNTTHQHLTETAASSQTPNAKRDTRHEYAASQHISHQLTARGRCISSAIDYQPQPTTAPGSMPCFQQ